MEKSNTTIIISAGGIGKRMGSEIPKQFIRVNGKPILLHTLENLYNYNNSFKFIITLPSDWIEYWAELRQEFNCTIEQIVVEGGQERYHSIKNALAFVETDYVLIHDAVRPLVAHKTIDKLLESLIFNPAVIPVVPLTDSIRKLDGTKTTAQDRSKFVNVQTPQAFKTSLLKSAYKSNFHSGITDDASLVEENGIDIVTIEGNIENIKITNQIDLAVLEFYVNKS